MKIKKSLFLFLISLSLFFNSSFGFEFKNPFKKKEPEPKPKMVETRQEWEEESQNIPLEARKKEENKKEEDKNAPKMPELNYVFERYNYPQGTRELNIEGIKKDLYYYSYIVADKDCQYGAYAHYYFSPDSNQISSNFYVEKLDTSLNKTKRIQEYYHKQKTRIPIIEAGTKEIYPNLFQGLTLVDWSNDSKKLLIKEKIGSTQNGIYKTNLYVYIMPNDLTNAYTIKLDDFDRNIKNYFIDWENKQLVKYHYDIIPLGFSAENDDIIVALLYVFDKEKNKIFLGTWGYNILNGQTLLLSKTNSTPQISTNGLILRQTLD